MAQIKLTMALSHYDRHIPLFDGSVQAEGVDLQVLEVGQSEPLKHGRDRHERMLQKGEFDVCELSLSSYLMAKSRGMPFTAIPVFPRRLFSLSQMWVNIDNGINSPQDLIGKRVGLSTFQTTLSVLAKGDLQSEYDVPWRKMDWVVSKEEAVPFKPQEGVRIELVAPGRKWGRCWSKVKFPH
jgi:4,5-dihydroxyphthalate decarboxylase